MGSKPEFTGVFLKNAKRLDPSLKVASSRLSTIFPNPRKGSSIIYRGQKS